nr:DUF3343 domain-containing protein [uncultured Acetobacterium sp.]
MRCYVITFANTHSAITTQSYLERNAKISIMPTLREISTGCGISIRFLPEEKDNVIAGLKAGGLDAKMFQIYEVIENDGRVQVSQIIDNPVL